MVKGHRGGRGGSGSGSGGRGGSGSGARGGRAAGQTGARNPGKNEDRICKPLVAAHKFPTSLLPTIHEEGIPAAVLDGLGEDFSCPQPFFNALERVRPDVSTSNCWLGIPGSTVEFFERDSDDRFFGTLTLKGGAKKPIFLKRIHIMDPIITIEGESVWPHDGALPAPREAWLNTVEKVTDPMNEAYVDAVFAAIADRLVVSNTSPHWCRSYGTFAARVERYQYNISEEYPSMRRKPFWFQNQARGIFEHVVDKDGASSGDARSPRVIFSDAEELDGADFEAVYADTVVSATAAETEATENAIEFEEVLEEVVQLAAPKIRLKKLESSSESTASTDSSNSSHESDAYEHYAEFKDFPVQVTLLERAEGTMDELLEAEEPYPETHWKSWIFQVIAALDVAQYYFGFAHNDLHTNNVMWSKTDKEFLYYRVNRGSATWFLRVPTYGYVMKIIDFGRASFWMPEPAGFFISDAFFPGNDACNQYNCDPFFDPKNGKRIDPNPSFDLSRLSVSMLETLFPERPAVATPIKIMSREGSKTYTETVSPLYNLMWEWLIDDAGKSILRTPEGEERYPDFDLYSAIAGEVHKAVPAHQIDKPIFADYKFKGPLPSNEVIYDLWVR